MIPPVSVSTGFDCSGSVGQLQHNFLSGGPRPSDNGGGGGGGGGGGDSHPDPEMRGRCPKMFFLALWASVWSKK